MTTAVSHYHQSLLSATEGVSPWIQQQRWDGTLGWEYKDSLLSVSYTHLTLPTNREV